MCMAVLQGALRFALTGGCSFGLPKEPKANGGKASAPIPPCALKRRGWLGFSRGFSRRPVAVFYACEVALGEHKFVMRDLIGLRDD